MHWPPPTGIVSIAITLLVLLWSVVRQRTALDAARQRRTAAIASRLRTSRLDFERQRSEAARPKLALQLQIGRRAERVHLRRLHALLRTLEERQQRAYEARQRDALTFSGDRPPAGYWHGVSGDGQCPAEVPQWDWQLLLKAAEAHDDGAVREAAIASLAAQSRIGSGELGDLAHRYAGVLANPEFAGILDSRHPACTGTRFASLEGDRVLRIQCDDPAGATYSLDEDSTLRRYVGPVRCVGRGHSKPALVRCCAAERPWRSLLRC